MDKKYNISLHFIVDQFRTKFLHKWHRMIGVHACGSWRLFANYIKLYQFSCFCDWKHSMQVKIDNENASFVVILLHTKIHRNLTIHTPKNIDHIPKKTNGILRLTSAH